MSSYYILVILCIVAAVHANFEDTRCRCICPSTQYFASKSSLKEDDNHRRYYTKSNIKALNCNPQTVVKANVLDIVDSVHLDAFLANCDCKHQSRNTVMLKVVVIFVICIVFVLVTYMLFLLCMDSMLMKPKRSVPYRQQTDEIDDMTFSHGSSTIEETLSIDVNSRNNSVFERVEAEKNRWMRQVEEQRKNIFTDRTMLN